MLARAYQQRNQYQNAISLLEHVLRIEEKSKQTDNVLILDLNWNLGQAYLEFGQYEKAVTLLEPVVEVQEKVLVPVGIQSWLRLYQDPAI